MQLVSMLSIAHLKSTNVFGDLPQTSQVSKEEKALIRSVIASMCFAQDKSSEMCMPMNVKLLTSTTFPPMKTLHGPLTFSSCGQHTALWSC